MQAANTSAFAESSTSSASSTDPLCPLCGDSGFLVVESGEGKRGVRDCECRVERRRLRLERQANIPARYADCSLDTFATDGPHEDSLYRALMACHNLVTAYPLHTNGVGLLLTGNPGVGKTHLAIGVLRGLIQRGAAGVFCHYHDLIKQVQNSYNRNVHATELEVLKPVFEAEILVLDEVGASRPTDWVFDTVSHILNTRYNERRITIITTNYPNAAPVLSSGRVLTAFAEAREALREETLGDRIGERMRSRLQEMCLIVEMQGVDYRQRADKQARLG